VTCANNLLRLIEASNRDDHGVALSLRASIMIGAGDFSDETRPRPISFAETDAELARYFAPVLFSGRRIASRHFLQLPTI
jgi:hypothetical protein